MGRIKQEPQNVLSVVFRLAVLGISFGLGSCPNPADSVLTTLKNEETPVATPQFSLSSGTFSSDQVVTISCSTTGATIYYTTDGSTPTTSSGVFSASSPIAVVGDGTIKTINAIAVKAGMKTSAVASATYTISYGQVSTPQFTPAPTSPPTTYTGDQKVTITCSTGGATIYYTTDGSTPTTSSSVYGGAVTVAGPNTTETIQAIAAKTGMKTSTTASGIYTVTYVYSLTVNVGGVGLWGVYTNYQVSYFGTTTPSGTTTISYGTATPISATANSAYPVGFVNWTVASGTGVSFGNANSATTTVTLTGGPATIQANFGLKIIAFAGTGTAGYNGDDISSTSAELYTPAGVTQDWPIGGAPWIADTQNQRIRFATTGNISTIAGNGTLGFSGDGGVATAAQLANPWGIAMSPGGLYAGNVFIADTSNSCIRMVSTPYITTVAGIGNTPGYSGDGGAATSAKLGYPYGVAVDSAGNIYIADTQNMRIRKVNTSGIISTVAGNGLQGYNGDNIAATSARLNFPYSVAVDGSGNIYIADNGNNRVRMVNTSGIITTVAGTGTGGYNGDNIAATSAQLNRPWGISLDNAGNLYIADSSNCRIRMVDTSGIITTIAGNGSSGFSGDGGPALSAGFIPYGVSVDGAGENLFIADQPHNRVLKVP